MVHRQSLRRVVTSLLLLAGVATACGKNGGPRGVASSGGAPGGGTGGTATGGATTGATATGGIGGQPSTGATATGGASENGATGGTAGVPGPDGAAAGGAGGEPADAGAAPTIIEAFAATARQIAADYLSWGRVDDEVRWAPTLCRMPVPAIARPSKSNDPETHGQKLYSVFAKDHAAYPSGPYTNQVVVKQSWTAELIAPGAPNFIDYLSGLPAPPRDAADHFYPYANGDGGVYRAAALAGLYIMFKLDPATPDTDEGWVYATITADGQLTAAGRISSCIACHEVAPHERLFGVPLSPLLDN